MAKKRKHIARAVIRIQKETPMNIAVKGNAEHVGTSTEGEHQMSTFDILPDLYANPTAILELIRQRDELLAALKYARELVDDWGAYATAYMQEKHDLAGDLDRLDAAISKVEEQS